MKISRRNNGTGNYYYSILITRAEADRAGLIAADGTSFDVEKMVNAKNGTITIRRTLVENWNALRQRFLDENASALLAGTPVIDADNTLFWLKGKDILTKKKDQERIDIMGTVSDGKIIAI